MGLSHERLRLVSVAVVTVRGIGRAGCGAAAEGYSGARSLSAPYAGCLSAGGAPGLPVRPTVPGWGSCRALTTITANRSPYMVTAISTNAAAIARPDLVVAHKWAGTVREPGQVPPRTQPGLYRLSQRHRLLRPRTITHFATPARTASAPRRSAVSGLRVLVAAHRPARRRLRHQQAPDRSRSSRDLKGCACAPSCRSTAHRGQLRGRLSAG